MLTWSMGALILLLVGVCYVLFRKLKWATYISENAQTTELEIMGRLQSVANDYFAVGEAVAATLTAIRRDIDRNYQHTHDVHLLNQIADEVRNSEGRGVIYLDGYARHCLSEAGGDRFFKNGFMSYDQALAFGWEQHRLARERAEQLFPIVQECCGQTDRAIWLSRSLAILERICDSDKKLAISSLEKVITIWKYVELEEAVRIADSPR